jgi:hypothetical protein
MSIAFRLCLSTYLSVCLSVPAGERCFICSHSNNELRKRSVTLSRIFSILGFSADFYIINLEGSQLYVWNEERSSETAVSRGAAQRPVLRVI